MPPAISFSELSPKNGESIDVVFNRLKAKYGAVFRVRIPFFAHFVITVGAGASKMYHMMKDEEASFNYGYRLFNQLGLGPSHQKAAFRDTRFVPLLEKAFSKERFNHFAKVTRAGHIEYLQRNWNNDVQKVDLFSEMYILNIRLIIRAFMGNFEDDKVNGFIETIRTLDLEERIKSIPNIVHNFTPGGRRELEKHWHATFDLVKYLVEWRKANKGESSSVEFFDYLVTETTDEKGVLDYELLTARVFSLIFAAVLNTFATSAWFLFRVFDNPAVYEKVKKEQLEYYEILQDPNAESGTALITKFPFSECVVREVIRTSVAGISFRRAVNDFVLNDNGTNHFIPKDAYVVMPYTTIIKDKSVFSDPEAFRPERFDTEAKGACENVTFGAGRHPCTGTKFAMLNVKNIAFNIMNFYKVEVPGKAEDFMPKMQSMGVFRPIKPVIFTMTKLKPIEL